VSPAARRGVVDRAVLSWLLVMARTVRELAAPSASRHPRAQLFKPPPPASSTWSTCPMATCLNVMASTLTGRPGGKPSVT